MIFFILLFLFTGLYSGSLVIPSFKIGTFNPDKYESGSLVLFAGNINPYCQHDERYFFGEYQNSKGDFLGLRSELERFSCDPTHAYSKDGILSSKANSARGIDPESVKRLEINQKDIKYVESFQLWRNLARIVCLPQNENYHFETSKFPNFIFGISDDVLGIKESYLNQENGLFYYVNGKNELYGADYAALQKYPNLFKPIKDAHIFNIPFIWKNVFIVLKYYYCIGPIEVRRKTLLRDVFLNNADAVFVHLTMLFYGGLFLLCYYNPGGIMGFVKSIALIYCGMRVIALYRSYQEFRSRC